ncbi:MAG TPA: type II toxin-antitoxin system RelE/ParE family toxin [Verrucomicrobiae bacterium]|nr:type II toxin-antitoxin system RelE/ParE family toxin [Verrucomicrobiae bacterium]
MRLSFHPLVQKDINAILRYYDGISTKLGDRFFAELTAAFDAALSNPQRGHPAELGLRSVNLDSFPFHFLYRILADRIRVTIVRHHKRHPRVGVHRR